MGRRVIGILFLVGGVVLLIVVAVVFLLQQDSADTPQVDETTAVAEDGATEEPGGAAPSEETVEGTLPPLIEVVVSLQTVPRGWQMTANELTTELRRSETVGANVITDLDDAIGLYARTDVFQGETLTNDMLVGDPTLAGVEDYGPSSLIPEGFVAQAVPMDRLSSVAYGLAPGDIVDVMMTFYLTQVDEEFQTLLQNSAVSYVEEVVDEETGETQTSVFIIDPFGRFETLPTGDLTLVIPSETQRPVRVSMIVQAARVIQVGPWTPDQAALIATPTPTPAAEVTPTPEAGAVPTATPEPPDVLLVALSPQQQLLLRYALGVNADVDFALRGPGDTQLYDVQNVDLPYLLQRFNIEPPVDFGFSAETIRVTVTPAPAQTGGEEGEGQ